MKKERGEYDVIVSHRTARKVRQRKEKNDD